jgi:putative N6-adenine-specific DNA methylase
VREKNSFHKLFAVCAPGLEPFTAQELANLGLKPFASIEPGMIFNGEDSGGVEFEGTLEDIWRANLQLRTASRIVLRFGDFYTTTFSELRKKSGQLAWENFLKPGQPVSIRVTCHKSRLYHSDGVAERITGAISDRVNIPVVVVKSKDETNTEKAQLIIVRLFHDHCIISIDTSGDLLHRRGYRLETAKAPIRETLAAGMLLASGWDAVSPLIDPFCGSGTIPIEAALIAGHISPGEKRKFAFMDWPGYSNEIWNEKMVPKTTIPLGEFPFIAASDRDAGAIQIAQANTRRAGFTGQIQYSCKAVSAITPPAAHGWIVTNPPYGVRVSANKDLRNLYAQLGNVLRTKCPRWHFAIMCSDLALLHHTGLHFKNVLLLKNGGIKVRLAIGMVD